MTESKTPSPYTNPNIRWIFAGGSFIALAESVLWFAPIWLIYSLGGSNTQLGIILGSASLVGIACSVGLSRWADRSRLDRVIKLASLLMVIGTLILSLAHTLVMVAVGMVISQTGFLTLEPLIQALLSNSTHSKHRNRIFGTKYLVFNIALALGNLLLFFFYRGQGTEIDELDSDLIRLSILIATGAAIIGTAFNFLLRDERFLLEAEEGNSATAGSPEQHGDGNLKQRGEGKPDRNRLRRCLAPGIYPIIVITLASPVFIGLGAGTTVPYFPRFFFDIYNLDLSNLSLAFAGLTLFTGVWGKVTANLADRFGRVEMVVANQLIAVLLLYTLATYPPFVIAISVLLLRNALMNGAWPVAGSLQMEYTPRRYRSQISAITFTIFATTFAVGQACGGWLADHYGFRILFIITATLYLAATLLYWRIRGLIRRLK